MIGGTTDPIRSSTSKAKTINPSEATFNVLVVGLFLVPFVIFSGHALLVLNIIECHSPKREELYICASSAVYLSSVFGGYTEADMQMGGPPEEIASLHQHT